VPQLDAVFFFNVQLVLIFHLLLILFCVVNLALVKVVIMQVVSRHARQ